MENNNMNNKKLILMRGAPGSGKSTLAKKLSEHVFSTDDFHMIDGKYVFNLAKSGEYHKQNQERVRLAMSNGLSPIVVDNTNTQIWEMKPYANFAKEYGYTLEIASPNTSWRFDIDELFKRNTHNVPREVIAKMLERLQTNIAVEDLI